MLTPEALGSLGRGFLRGGANERPLNVLLVLTESWDFDIMHRRAGRDARPKGYVIHADSHKYCPLGRCGTRTGPYTSGRAENNFGKKAKIIAWRKARSAQNRAYLEENVYGRSKARMG